MKFWISPKDYNYSDEKIKEFRKILKGSLTLVKSMATLEVVMDSVAVDFRVLKVSDFDREKRIKP